MIRDRCVIAIAGLLIVGAHFAGAQSAEASLVEVHSHKLNVVIGGTRRPGVPTVVFSNGLGAPIPLWSDVQADLDSTLATVNAAIYNYMQGPSEFTITGTLKRYDVTAQLATIRVPTLYTVGEFDEANPPTIRHFAELTPGAHVAVLAGAAHLTPWDAREENVRIVRAFLRRSDSTVVRP